jgi:hypothetical protein
VGWKRRLKKDIRVRVERWINIEEEKGAREKMVEVEVEVEEEGGEER